MTLNPFDNQAAFGTMKLGPNAVPGIILEIDGADREYEWDVQKPVATGGASNNYKGQKVADSIKVKCALVTASHFVALERFRTAVKPAKGKKPSAFDVVNAILTNNGIKSVTIKKIGQERYEGNGLWTFTLELLEHDPAKATATGAVAGSKSSGAAGAAPGSPGYVESAQSKADKEIEELLKKAQAA